MKGNNPAIEIFDTPSGYKTASYHQKFLHSKIDPHLEAVYWITENKQDIEKGHIFLLLGLGMGHHLEKLVQQLKENKQQQYLIGVVEPLTDFCENFQQNSKNLENIIFFSKNNPEDYYEDENFIDFLLQRPNVIYHHQSYQANNNFYRSLISYRSSQLIKFFWDKIQNHEIQSALEPYQELSINRLPNEIKNKQSMDKQDFLLMALLSLESVEL